jgi:chromatin segregation and condensation protein Rec8/ScpA/Scc1 (kleisin family)
MPVTLDLLAMLEAVQRVIDGIPEPVLHRVVARPLDVEGATARIEALLADLDRTEFSWREALGVRPNIVDVLSTFLALLELAKRGLLHLHQPAPFADMVIRRDSALPAV